MPDSNPCPYPCICSPETCDDLCQGGITAPCGCKACAWCFEPDAPQPNPDDPYCPVLNRCDCCGRPAADGHKPECVIVGGDLDYSGRRQEKLKEQIKRLKRELAKKEAELKSEG